MTGLRVAAVIVLALAATTLPEPAQGQKKGDRDRIARADIMASAKRTFGLYEVIRELRPRFLEPPRGVRSFGNSNTPYTPIAVYLDGRREGGLETLRGLDAESVDDVRYMDPERANAEYGPSAAGGAVIVRLWKAGRVPARADTTPP